jgi:hypothetical protein
LLPFEDFFYVNGKFRYIERDIRIAPVRHIAAFSRYHATHYLMQREERHGVAPFFWLAVSLRA